MKRKIILDNKGFAITTIIYSMLLLFIVLMAITIATLSKKNNLLNSNRDITNGIIGNIEANKLTLDFICSSSVYFGAPKFSDGIIEMSGPSMTYYIPLTSAGYSFDYTISTPNGSIAFCTSANNCSAIPRDYDSEHVTSHGSYINSTPGFLKLSFGGCNIQLTNFKYLQKPIEKIQTSFASPSAPSFTVEGDCDTTSFNSCSKSYNTNSTATGTVYVILPQNGFGNKPQIKIDDGEWTDMNSKARFYYPISSKGTHNIRVRMRYGSGPDYVYSQESEPFKITIN